MKRKEPPASARPAATTASPVASEREVMFGAELMVAVMLTVQREHRALFIEAVGGYLATLARVAKLRDMAGTCIGEEHRHRLVAREGTALLLAADELLNVALEESGTYGQACALIAGEFWHGPADLPRQVAELDHRDVSKWALEEFRKARRALRARERRDNQCTCTR
jgi:hypothetical protein